MGRSVIVIGGGASGMTAAIFAARAGASVTIVEHGEKLGKKILSTGNGRCNLTNLHMDAGCFRSDNAGFAAAALKLFGAGDALEFFDGLGLVVKDKNGYVYPRSEQASAVRELLVMETERLGIRAELNIQVRRILCGKTGRGTGFCVETDRGTCASDCLILAAGGKAASFTGSDGSGYALAESLGHRIIQPLPALVQLRCGERVYKSLAGVRTDGRVRLLVNGKTAAEDSGEIQLTDYGISGIPVFQVSRFASVGLAAGQPVEASLDFCPEMEFSAVEERILTRGRQLKKMPAAVCGDLLNGWFNKKMIPVLLERAGIGAFVPAGELKRGQARALTAVIKDWKTKITAVNSFDSAQVCRGGADTRQVNPETMESRRVRGLYFAGEILDVDGICGGYNLQWAWTSGALAGKNAGGNR